MLKTTLYFACIITILSCNQSTRSKVKSIDSINKPNPQSLYTNKHPYKDSAMNVIYNLLFCDNLDLYKETVKKPVSYPFDVLFSETSSIDALQKIADDRLADARVRILAYNAIRARDYRLNKKQLLAVIVEVGLDEGLDVVASFGDGSARYINQTGKLLVWERTTDDTANKLKDDLFFKSNVIINKIAAWDKPRLPAPLKGNARITFLVSDGLYFGEGPVDVLFADSLAGPALNCAALLMKYLTEKSLTAK